MGQVISRRLMPHLSRAISKHEQVMAKDALDDIALRKAKAGNSKYIDPSAVHGGFRRDTWTENELSQQERQQRDFLRLSNLNPGSSWENGIGNENERENENPHEMPEDLIQFLNDAGPLERKVDKDLTSPRVYDALKEEEKREDLRKDLQRKKRVMPMIENDGGNDRNVIHDESPMDGTTVSRTTNFSVTPAKKDKSEIRLDDGALFQLLSRLQAGEVSAEKFVKDQFKDDSSSIDGDESSFIQKRNDENVNIINNITAYTEIPILMQDTDGSLVGASSEQVEQLRFLKVRMAPNHVKLCLEPDEFAAHQVGKSINDVEDDGMISTGRRGREQPMTTEEFLRRAKSGSM